MKNQKSLNLFFMLLAGSSIGWMAGMSVTPVIGTILGTLLSILAGLVSLLAGLPGATENETNSNWFQKVQGRISVLPVALLIVGIAAGSVLGIMTRSHEWLVPERPVQELTKSPVETAPAMPSINVDSMVEVYSRWGLDSTQVAAQILQFQLDQAGKAISFQREMKKATANRTAAPRSKSLSAVLYSGEIKSVDCRVFCTMSYSNIRRKIKAEFSGQKAYTNLLTLSEAEMMETIQENCCR